MSVDYPKQRGHCFLDDELLFMNEFLYCLYVYICILTRWISTRDDKDNLI